MSLTSNLPVKLMAVLMLAGCIVHAAPARAQHAVAEVAEAAEAAAAAGAAAAAAPVTEASKAYQEAYNMVLDEKWSDASSKLSEFLKKYPHSAWQDAARFWQCYAEAQIGNDLEEAFDCYSQFYDSFPNSRWRDDARKYMIDAARKLVKAGKPEYEAFISSNRQSEDTEVALSAIMALQHTGSDLALPALLELFNSTGDENSKEQMVFLLSQFETREAKAKLVSLAKGDPGDNVREKALFWLSQSDEVDPEDIRVIVEVVNSDSSPKVREQGVFALSQLEDRQGAQPLIDLARGSKDARVRQKALFWLSQSDEVTDEDIKSIQEIVEIDPDTKVREQGVFALSQLEDRQGVAAMRELARTHPDANIRQKALFWLSQSDEVNEGDIKAILEIIKNDDDPRVREQGVFALSQIEDGLGMAAMRELARKHPDPNIRDKALFWMAQSDEVSSEDIQLIVGVINNDSDAEVRRGGLLALSQIDDDGAIDALLKIAREHPDKEFRKKAVQFLGYSDNPRAQEALIELSLPQRK